MELFTNQTLRKENYFSNPKNQINMSSITYECDVTQFDVLPPKENNENIFVLNPKCLIINLMDNERIMFQSEIEKQDAIKLAQLILLRYNQ